jgi:hypothetical protein
MSVIHLEKPKTRGSRKLAVQKSTNERGPRCGCRSHVVAAAGVMLVALVLLAKGAWRAGYRGLAAVIATSWDTQLSPVDVRGLTAAQAVKDSQGLAFMLDRAKTRPCSSWDSFIALRGGLGCLHRYTKIHFT